MFPHNSSSHEISTETNAFVQNSKGDVVVLEGSSLSGVGEENGPEHAGYCDIEFINSSTMAAPTSHPESTAANDFSTVLSCHSGELDSAGVRSDGRSLLASAVAATTINSSPVVTVVANIANTMSSSHVNNIIINDRAVKSAKVDEITTKTTRISNRNNAEHNHHKCRKQKNKNNTPHRCWPAVAISQAANSKSTSKPLSDNKDSFSSVSPRVLSLRIIRRKLYNKLSSKNSVVYCKNKMIKWSSSRGLKSSLVRIPKSDGQRAFNLKAKNSHVSYFKPNNSKSVISLSSSCNFTRPIIILMQQRHLHNSSSTASSSITLNNIVSKGAGKMIASFELSRRLISALCVPLMIGTPMDFEVRISTINPDESRRIIIDGISCTEATICTVGALSFQDNNKSNEPLKNTSFKNVALIEVLSYDEYDRAGERESNVILKSLSKSTPSVKSSDKSDTDNVVLMINEYNYYDHAMFYRGAVSPGSKDVPSYANFNDYKNFDDKNSQDKVDQLESLMTSNIPNKLTTCEPIMTLTSQTNDVPAEMLQDVDCKINYLEENNKSEKMRSSLMKDCKDLLADYWTTRDPRYLTRLREAFDTLMKITRDLNNSASIKSSTTSDMTMIKINPPKIQTSCVSSLNFIQEYKQRWGISSVVGLCGGGESSLNNSAAANWASTQPTTPNNNNQNQSGWGGSGNAGTGGTPNNQPGAQAGPPTNWQTVSGPRTIGNQNPNQNQNQGQPGGPPTNQGPNNPQGVPTSQPNNQSQPNAGNNAGNAGQWNQGAGKPNPVGPNPQAQNNNGGNGPPQQQSPNVQQQAQQVQAQQVQPNGGNNNQQIANAGPAAASAATTPTTNNPTTKQQLEQLNTMREALFSPDGWGCQHVNQDTNWDVPTSPEPSMNNKDGVPIWKPPVNNGTDLWEANLRNGGQPPPQQQTKTPWGHTPSTNIGGTWGEDDDTADSSNMWTGAPPPNQANNAQWPGNSGNQNSMWTGGAASGAATGGGGGGGSNWGDPRDPRDPREIRPVDPREMRVADPRDPRDHRMPLDPREQHIRAIDPMVRDPRMPAEMRVDTRGGISGRLNGANADAMWNQPPGPPHHQMPGHQHPSGPPGKMITPSSLNQWNAPPPKDMMPGKPSGWEEPSPPTQRRNMPNYDDGTSLWANPAANPRTMQNKVSHWKDAPAQNIGRGGMQCPPGMLQNQMPGQPGMKPDSVGGGGGGGPMWGSHPGSGGPSGAGHNGSWADGPPDGANWNENNSRNRRYPDMIDPRASKTLWDEHQKSQQMGPSGAGNWIDNDMDPSNTWGHAKPALTKEMIWKSREFRYLCDLGFKKDDVETALRTREMNRDEAMELLNSLRPSPVDQWRRHESGHSGFDPNNQSNAGQPFPRFNHATPQQMSFPPAARSSQSQPSTQQLRMLVQQIQLAVQEGYLNHQILNQPLAPQTLILLNQLLQQIKVLQQLHQQHSMQNSLKGNGQNVLQISVQITKTKQQIANLQNQIAVQQATYMKQQQQQQQHPTTPSQSDYYKPTPSMHDTLSALGNNFSDLNLNKEPPGSQQQSRLNQWKLPALDKDIDSVANEFSRAPGTSSNKPPTTPVGLGQSHNSPNMNPLLGPNDGTWSSRLGDSGWPDTGNNDSTDGKDWQPGGAGAAFTDLVPEFEPGKPWKMKSIEDDPSITPGSVVRSPLLAAIKEPDNTIFATGGSKTSPPPQSVSADSAIPSLSNSTWSFNPPATTPSVFTSSKNSWAVGDVAPPPTPTATTSELWGAPMNKRGPPPGLGNKGTGGSISNVSNGWTALSRSNTWGMQSNAPGAGGANPGWVSPSLTWLLLKNLTPQIDGSTLKTLCMQHGPVQDFRLYLNHGIALAKYSSRDEAMKAQGALNNCVLGNTTIFAESPIDSEVHSMLQQLMSHQGSGGGSSSGAGQQQQTGAGGVGWSGLRPAANKAGPAPGDTWGAANTSQLWGTPQAGNSLWSNTGIDSADQQRATPSSLNSYLPGDLLGGESM